MDEQAKQALAERLMPIFLPYALSQRDRLVARGGRFVHYTSAENALRILESKKVWMRNTRCMIDFMEVEHGFEYLFRFFADKKNRAEFFDATNNCAKGAAEQAIGLFDKWLPTIRANTYITCISEHDDGEDLHGRLSMWRAHGRNRIGVAVVLNSAPFMLKSDVLKAYASPVSYLTEEQFHTGLRAIIENIRKHDEFLKTVPRDSIVGAICNMLLFAATSSKHPGFHEEREWRVIHVAKYMPSNALEEKVEVVDGVPQIVLKIPLQDVPEKGLVGIEIPKLVSRVIIGPSSFPIPIYDAFVSSLRKIGMSDPESKIVISGIPLRT